MAQKSLWLFPGKKVQVNLRERFGDYPYFLHTLDEYENLKVPDIVTVTWQPLKPLLTSLDSVDDDEEEMHNAWITQVKEWMKAGDDIPPVLLIARGEVFDGRHRTWAGDELGLKLAPVVDLTPYWREE